MGEIADLVELVEREGVLVDGVEVPFAILETVRVDVQDDGYPVTWIGIPSRRVAVRFTDDARKASKP